MPDPALRESIRVQNGTMPLLDKHLARLATGGCSEEVVEQVRVAANTAAEEWPMDYGFMSITVALDDFASIMIRPKKSSILVEGNPIAELIETDVPELPPGAAKPAARSFWDGALAKAQLKGANIAILVNHEGHIFDGSQASVWLRFGDVLVTPPSPPALAGVSREVVIERAGDLGYRVEERVVTVQDYESAEEVFLSTAVGGVASVRGREGEAVEKLKVVFDEIFGIAG